MHREAERCFVEGRPLGEDLKGGNTMKRIAVGLLAAGMLAGAGGAAVAQPYYGYYSHDRDYGGRYDNDWRGHDNGWHRGWNRHRRHYGSYGYYQGYSYAPVRV